jgi:hypothetical protein
MPHILDSDASQSRNREQSFVAPVMSSMQCIVFLVTRYRATLNSVGNGSTRLKFWGASLGGHLQASAWPCEQFRYIRISQRRERSRCRRHNLTQPIIDDSSLKLPLTSHVTQANSSPLLITTVSTPPTLAETTNRRQQRALMGVCLPLDIQQKASKILARFKPI